MKVSRLADRGHGRVWRRAAPAPVFRTAAFAEALSARFRRGLKQPFRLDLPLAARSRFQSLALHRHEAHTVNQFAVTLQTVLRRTYNTPPSVSQNLTARRLPVLTLPRTAHTERAAVPTASLESLPLVHANPLLPILARRARVESPAAKPASPLLAAPVPAVSASFRTLAPAAHLTDDLPMARVRSIPQARFASAIGTEGAASPSPPPPPVARSVVVQPLPPHEVERIAEQVIGSIDRRIIAERERMGRV